MLLLLARKLALNLGRNKIFEVLRFPQNTELLLGALTILFLLDAKKKLKFLFLTNILRSLGEILKFPKFVLVTYTTFQHGRF